MSLYWFSTKGRRFWKKSLSCHVIFSFVHFWLLLQRLFINFFQQVHEYLRSKLCSLYENDCIFDKFECCWNGNDRWALFFPLELLLKQFCIFRSHFGFSLSSHRNFPNMQDICKHFWLTSYLLPLTPALSITVVICSVQGIRLHIFGWIEMYNICAPGCS